MACDAPSRPSSHLIHRSLLTQAFAVIGGLERREAGDRRHADRLLMAWRARGRRAADYAALEAAAAAEFDASDLTDAELWREICEMQGWPAPDEAGGVALEDLDEAAWAALCAGRHAVPG